jgi:hypothetical protein
LVATRSYFLNPLFAGDLATEIRAGGGSQGELIIRAWIGRLGPSPDNQLERVAVVGPFLFGPAFHPPSATQHRMTTDVLAYRRPDYPIRAIFLGQTLK